MRKRRWDADAVRDDLRTSAGVPDGLVFATEPQLAVQMVERARDAGPPARWVAGDEASGDSPPLQTALEQHRTSSVLTVSRTHLVVTQVG
ncbi:transposase [Kitasatospora sp. NPDC057223]|uniref:transposase n=1 Tax=Kitasatospora sp. NPDC057223 TaxID=3346055 RepID=UPI00363F1B0B